MTLGIVDVGTNSIHLLIGILGLNGKFHVILKERDLTRLGEGGLSSGRLTTKAMGRARSVLQRYMAILKRCEVDHVEAVATSAVREATNGKAFVRLVRSKLGLPLRIVSGREEARLIYLGVLQTVRFRHTHVMITIGGGSAQVMVGNGTRLAYATSRLLGGARLAQRFIRHDPPSASEVDVLDRSIRRAWAPVVQAVRRHRWHGALGSSATIYQLMMAAHLRTHRHPPHGKHRLSISQPALRRLVTWLSTSTATERRQLDGLDPRREDLALPTGIALLAWMEGCRIARLRYAPGSIREGLVIDYLLRHHERIQRIDNPLEELFSTNGTWDVSLVNSRLFRRRKLNTHGMARGHR